MEVLLSRLRVVVHEVLSDAEWQKLQFILWYRDVLKIIYLYVVLQINLYMWLLVCSIFLTSSEWTEFLYESQNQY